MTNPSSRSFQRNLLRGIMASSILLSGFLCGFNVSLFQSGKNTSQTTLLARILRPLSATAAGTSGSGGDSLTPPDIYQRVLNTIKRSYAGDNAATTDLSTKRLTYAAIDGMLATVGDRYTEFWTPEEYDENMQETTGNFVGIGARLDITPDKRVVILEPIEGSPAARAGILAGDLVTAVNGHPVTTGQDLQAVIGQIRGAENTYVKLTVQRAGRPILFNLKRSVVHSPIVEWRMEDTANKIGYIKLGMFNEQADIQFDAALAKLEKQNLRALIFDLRNNPGGLLQVAQDLASRFVESGPIVWVKEKNGHLSSLDVESDKHRSPLYKGAYPVVVLVNGDSASAAEIVAGAIQDSGAGVLVGTRTYGKGLVQTIMPLADESAVKITTQHYFTRDKHDINIKRDNEGRALSGTGGVVPNLPVTFTDQDLAAQRDFQRRDPRNKPAADRLDPQINKALEFLTGELAKGPTAP